MVAAGVWAPVVQLPLQEKLRNDSSSFALDFQPTPPALSTSFILSFTKQPEIKPIPRAFIFFPFLSVLLLKTFHVINCPSECIRRWRRVLCCWSLKSRVHVFVPCEGIRDLCFPLSLTTLLHEKVEPQCLYLYSDFRLKRQGLGDNWQSAGQMTQHLKTLSFATQVYCMQVGACVCARARVCRHACACACCALPLPECYFGVDFASEE